ncbi:MAG TPA: hypothetical protein VK762_19165 [Polyangiaceae bacterium]|nr:hypothetical protein [Polyangiaceae bacterium]
MATVFLLTQPALAHGDDRAHYRAVFRVDSAEAGALLGRLRGQIVDTAVEVVKVEAGPLEHDLQDQLRTAQALAQHEGAEAVVWCQRADADPSAELVVAIVVPRARRMLVRTVPQPAGSAALEAAAIVVRSVLEGLASGGTIGVETPAFGERPSPSATVHGDHDRSAFPTESAVLPTPTPAVALRPPPEPATVIPSHPPPEDAAPAALGAAKSDVAASASTGVPPATAIATTPANASAGAWALSLGWQSSWDGTLAAGQEAVAAGLEFRWPKASLGLVASVALGGSIHDTYADAYIVRHTAAVQAGWLFAATKGRVPVRLWGLVHGGLGAYQRTTSETRPDAQAAPAAWTFSAVAGPDLRLDLEVGTRSIAAALTIGLDLWATAPTFGDDINGHFVASHSPWPVQPRIGLEVTFESL